jgi:hypothetical protein
MHIHEEVSLLGGCQETGRSNCWRWKKRNIHRNPAEYVRLKKKVKTRYICNTYKIPCIKKTASQGTTPG